MHYRLEQRIHTLAHNYIDRVSTSTPSFEVEGVTFSAWKYTLETGGREHPYWLASWETDAERFTKAWDQFWDKLSFIVPRIAVVSQCYTAYVDEPILIVREGSDRAFLRYYKEHRGVGLSFMDQELTALIMLLQPSDIPDEFFWNWSDATHRSLC